MTDEKAGRAGGHGVVEELRASGALDGLFERIDSGEVELTGSDGLLPALRQGGPRVRAGRGADRSLGL